MSFKKFFFIALILTMPLFSAAQNLSVQVRNSENGRPVGYAYITIHPAGSHREPTVGAYSDEAGRAHLILDSFPAVLQIIATGYDPETLLLTDTISRITVDLVKRFNTLDEVVVTGVPRPQKPQSALASYKIIPAAQIHARGAVTLNEALSNQLNISLSNDAVLGSGVRMQGMGGDKVKVLLNGIALNGREGGNIDLGQINLANVERIEVVQGPMSIIYGTDALGGVINVIEKEGTQPWILQATAHYESVGKYNFQAGGSRSWKRHSVSVSGGRNYFQGWKYLDEPVSYGTDTIYPQRNFLFKPKEQYLAEAGYRYTAGDRFRLHFGSSFLKEKVTNKGLVEGFDPFNGVTATDEYYYTTRSVNRLTLEGKVKTLNWKMLNGFAYYHRVRNSYKMDLATLQQTLSTAAGSQDTSTFQDLTSRGVLETTKGRLSLTAGYDVTLQRGTSKKISGVSHALDDYALFAMATASFLNQNKLKLQAGLRGSYNSQFDVPLIPAVNLLFAPSERLQLRASYAQGYRAPSLKEMYLNFIDLNHQIFGNENLYPEKGDHFQISVSQSVFRKTNGFLQWILSGYYNKVHNGIMLIPLHPEDPLSIAYQYGNLHLQENLIASLQIEAAQGAFHYNIGYAFNHTFAQTDYGAFNAQEVTADVSFFWRKPKLHLSAFYKFTGAQPFLRGSIDGSVRYDGRQPEYHMLDASIERKFWKKRCSLTIGMKNIFNVQTLTATGLTQSGVHSGNGNINFLPRSFFSTLAVTLQ